MKKSGNGTNGPIFLRRVPAGSGSGGTQLIPLTSLPNNARFLRPSMVSGASPITIRPVTTTRVENPNTPLPITLSLPRVPVAPTLTTNAVPRQQNCLVLPNQPVPQREVFQRPLPPSNRPQMVRAVLIQRPGLNPAQPQQQQQTVLITPTSGQQIISHQRVQSVNTGTPLPNIQLPSEPLPITAQEMQQHLSFSSPATSPSPTSEHTFIQSLEMANQNNTITINSSNNGSVNGFTTYGGMSSTEQQGGPIVNQVRPLQQNPQKIFIQVMNIHSSLKYYFWQFGIS